MHSAKLWCALFLLASALAPQNPPPSSGPPAGFVRPPRDPSIVEGVVVHDLTGQPLSRTRVMLQRLDNKRSVATITDNDGNFRFRGLDAGFYSFSAEREGFLKLNHVIQDGRLRQSLLLWQPGQRISGLMARLRPAGVIAGKVRHPDGEPAIGVGVQAFREYYVRGRKAYTPAGSAITNDLGEYRIHSLRPGTYYVAALHQPPEPMEGVEEQMPDLPHTVSTFYSSGTNLANAIPLRITAESQVTTADIALQQERTVSIRGEVLDGTTNERMMAPTISLRWPDLYEAGSVPVPARIRISEGRFEISGVTPGRYWLVAEGSRNNQRLSVRQPITVGRSSIEDLVVNLTPEREITGRVRFEEDIDYGMNTMRVLLEPRSETATRTSAQIQQDGSFSARVMPDETYDIFVDNHPSTSYLKSAQSGSTDLLTNGLQVGRTEVVPPIELVLATRAATVSGNVLSNGGPVAGATVVLLPQSMTGRVQGITATVASDAGSYEFRGVAPGQYIVFAWLTEIPCEPFSPEAAAECAPFGRAIAVRGGDVGGVDVVVSR
jgi:hypothetical protein